VFYISEQHTVPGEEIHAFLTPSVCNATAKWACGEEIQDFLNPAVFNVWQKSVHGKYIQSFFKSRRM